MTLPDTLAALSTQSQQGIWDVETLIEAAHAILSGQLVPVPSVEMVARAACQSGGFDPDEMMSNDGPRWRYYEPIATAVIAALAQEPK